MKLLKYYIKNIIGIMFRRYCGIFKILEGKIFIFMYHRVKDINDSENLYDSAMFVSNITLGMHITELSKHFEIISLDDLENADSISALPKCILTFDDGWADNYHYALPILSSTHTPATIFITVNYIGSNKCFWFHNIWLLAQHCLQSGIDSKFFHYFNKHVGSNNDLIINEENIASIIAGFKSISPEDIEKIVNNAFIELGLVPNSEPIMLTWEQVQKISNNSVMIGSHGMSHHILTKISENDCAYEIIESFAILNRNINLASKYFCYPNGNYDELAINLVKQAGYAGAIGTEIGYNTSTTNKYCLNRIAIHDEISSTAGLLWFRIFQAYLKTRH